MQKKFSTHRGMIFLLLIASALSLTKCAIIDELTTEPGSSTTTTRSRTGSDRETAMRESVVTYAERYVGTKYRYAGNTPSSGFDCSGFTCYVMREFDVDLPRSSRTQADVGKRVDVKEGRPGDLVFFKRSRTGPVFHVAIVYENDRNGLKVIHSTSRGVVIDNISQSSYWKPKIFSVREVL